MGIFLDQEEFVRNVQTCKFIFWVQIFRALVIGSAITFLVTYLLLIYLLEIVMTGEELIFLELFLNYPDPFNCYIHGPGVVLFTVITVELVLVCSIVHAPSRGNLLSSPIVLLYILITGCYTLYTSVGRDYSDDIAIICRLLILLIIIVTFVLTYVCNYVFANTNTWSHDYIRRVKKNISEEKKNVTEEKKNISQE